MVVLLLGELRLFNIRSYLILALALRFEVPANAPLCVLAARYDPHSRYVVAKSDLGGGEWRAVRINGKNGRGPGEGAYLAYPCHLLYPCIVFMRVGLLPVGCFFPNSPNFLPIP